MSPPTELQVPATYPPDPAINGFCPALKDAEPDDPLLEDAPAEPADPPPPDPDVAPKLVVVLVPFCTLVAGFVYPPGGGVAVTTA